MRQAFHSCVPEHLASRQMLHSHHKPRLAPLYIRRTQGLERAPRRGETLHLSEKLFPLIPTKRDECRSGVFQSITVREQRHECAGLAVAVCADYHKSRLGEAFGLEPSLASARPIGCQRMFGDDALKLSLSAGPKQVSTITVEFFAELDATFSFGSDQVLQLNSTLRESLLAKVLPIEVQKVKCIQDDAVRLPPHRGA